MVSLLFVKHSPSASKDRVIEACELSLSEAVSRFKIEPERWCSRLPDYPGRSDLPKGYQHAFVEIADSEAQGTMFKAGFYPISRNPVEIMTEFPDTAKRVRQQIGTLAWER